MKNIPGIALFIGFCFVFTLFASGNKSLKKEGIHTSIRMADSEMKQFPESWTVDYNPKGSWNYTPGLIALSMINLWEQTGDQKYYDYAKSYADHYINDDGVIAGYKKTDYSTDLVNSGKFLFTLYKKTGEERFKTAIFSMREQLKNHPRTSEGGFWHKLRYPHQMWLDGLYMEAPFYAQFAKEFNEPDAFEDIINQFVVIDKHTYDPKTGLNYHGWDESKEQKWANPETGCSPHFWGRAMGWYSMALVDVLDFIPKNHPKRNVLIELLKKTASGIEKWQDKNTGLWYQVLDQGKREGNYLEASASAMFTYSLLKATRLKYIDKKYRPLAQNAYQGILSHLVRDNGDGTIGLTNVCSVAGLGGDPYRDGSYEYYVREPRRDNDPKGVGPFIMAGIEMSR